MKLAVIGAGPSAFYVASRIFKLVADSNIRIHIFDRLWSPHGLVRYGVAPDHPEVKNCTHKFDEIAKDSRFRFFGNVNIGGGNPIPSHALSVPLSSIFKNYSHVLFATGCTLPNLHPDLLPSQFCVSALSIVRWYTNHPTAPPPPPLHDISHLSIIGNGNVSLDVARILLTDVGVLAKYDVPKPVLDVLSTSNLRHISIIARRGPLDAAFTIKELRELVNLPNASMVPLHPSLTAVQDGTPLSRQQQRILQLLSSNAAVKPKPLSSKSWSLEFFRSPNALELSSASSAARLSLSLAHTTTTTTTTDNIPRALPTGQVSKLPTDLVVTSLGFHSDHILPDFHDSNTGRLRNVSGRITSSTGQIFKNVYASGWAATGAKGVLASTMMNAYGVADTIVRDWKNGSHVHDSLMVPFPFRVNEAPDIDSVPEEIASGLNEKKVVEYGDWKIADLEEMHRGSLLGKERERLGWQEARNLFKT